MFAARHTKIVIQRKGTARGTKTRNERKEIHWAFQRAVQRTTRCAVPVWTSLGPSADTK